MDITEAKNLLDRYRSGDTVCISSPEWAMALSVALEAEEKARLAFVTEVFNHGNTLMQRAKREQQLLERWD